MTPLLGLQNIRHQYNGRTVLDIPLLKLSRGSITGLAGPNGSGKSTLLKIMALVEKCSTGSISFEDKPILPFDNGTRRLFAFLPQEAYLLKRTVFANISYGLKIRGRKNKLPQEVAQALELVGLAPAFANRQWYELSGGELQRVALASRLVLRPVCLMLDEPIASVDLESSRNIQRAILSAREQWGTTIIVSSHQQSWLNAICDRIVYLYNGRLLDCSYKNVLLGPWEKFSNDLSIMKMTDGQLLYVQKPPGAESSGVIAPQALKLSSAPPSGNKKGLSGRITAIFAEKQPDVFCVHVICGEQQFIIDITAQQLIKKGLLPNQKVYLSYNPSDIVWLS